MAEGESEAKLIKIDRSEVIDAFSKNTALIKDTVLALEAFNYLPNALTLMTLQWTNAAYSMVFSDANCFYKARPCAGDAEAEEFYSMQCVFQRGTALLRSFLEDPNDSKKLPSNVKELECLEKLLKLLLKNEEVAGQLATDVSSRCEPLYGEMSWTLRLAHHLFTELALDQQYKIDEFARKPQGKPKDRCPCCNEPISQKGGYLGDTSLGNPKYWHGSVDMLIGSVAAITVKGNHNDRVDGEDDSDNHSDSSFEIKVSQQDDVLTITEEFQVISETIVCSLIQKIQDPDSQHSLVPTIAIKNHDIYFYMYDGKYDILLKTAPYPLISCFHLPLKLNITTILGLWFTINYKLLCTGITEDIQNQDFHANFLSSLNEEARTAYERKLKFGQCHYGPSAQRYQPNISDRGRVVTTGTPVESR